MSELTIPLSNYLQLIRKRKSPYYDLLRYVIADMERRYVALEYPMDVVYTINPRQLQREIAGKISNEKLTTTNITRVVMAALRGSRLREEEDYYVTTSAGGRKNYHIKLNPVVLSILQSSF